MPGNALRVSRSGPEDLDDRLPRGRPHSEDDLPGALSSLDWMYRKYADPLRRFCQSRLDGDFSEAEDACHESMIRAYEALRRYQPRAMWPWLATIAANVCIGMKRKRARTICVEDVGVSASPANTEAEADRHIREQIVNRAVSCLPERYRTFVLLHDFDGWSYEQLAAVNDISVGAVASVLLRARKALKVEIRKAARAAGQWPLGNSHDLAP